MIKLSKLTDYAVVVLAEMAGRPGEVLSAAALSEATRLPEPTVAKILKLLGKSGLVASLRGASGGYRLDRDAGAVTINDIIAAVEGPIALTACVDGSHETCVHEGGCTMRGRWSPVNVALQGALARITLADMVLSREGRA